MPSKRDYHPRKYMPDGSLNPKWKSRKKTADTQTEIRTSSPPSGSMYQSWEDFLDRTTESYRKQWCQEKARKANVNVTRRYDSTQGRVIVTKTPLEIKLSTANVLKILVESKGRCAYCGSLALERQPKSPLQWQHIGRRIGSLDHIKPKHEGGDNSPENLCWSCLLCNTFPELRFKGAADHGGFYIAHD